ncbi:hypothetical protein EVAR_22675_1 [Eumeta japonica]|uniref:Uncharacterized protein n=1 Tax=Eumeta variegata TaxID=151549 RepID=A0A4C1VJI5_EUMVA|nr:hypothetical protein EVAR_22675_1 [Eumeta japonica]
MISNLKGTIYQTFANAMFYPKKNYINSHFIKRRMILYPEKANNFYVDYQINDSSLQSPVDLCPFTTAAPSLGTRELLRCDKYRFTLTVAGLALLWKRKNKKIYEVAVVSLRARDRRPPRPLRRRVRKSNDTRFDPRRSPGFVLMNDRESCVWQKKYESRVSAVAIRSLCNICGLSLKDRCRNSDVRERCGLKEDVVARVEIGILRRSGHLERINECRLTKQIYRANVSNGKLGRQNEYLTAENNFGSPLGDISWLGTRIDRYRTPKQVLKTEDPQSAAIDYHQ